MSNIKYIVAEEWSAPSLYKYGTDELLEDEAQVSVQYLWVVEYNEDEQVVESWLERFEVGDDEAALARAEELNREREEIK